MTTEGGWNDPDAIADERFQADCEQAELEAAGNRHHRAVKRSAALRAAGKLPEAAAACPHGWRGPAEGYDWKVEKIYQCYECGSVIQELDPENWWKVRVIAPCVFSPEDR